VKLGAELEDVKTSGGDIKLVLEKMQPLLTDYCILPFCCHSKATNKIVVKIRIEWGGRTYPIEQFLALRTERHTWESWVEYVKSFFV
jgi:hypothetical protein